MVIVQDYGQREYIGEEGCFGLHSERTGESFVEPHWQLEYPRDAVYELLAFVEF